MEGSVGMSSLPFSILQGMGTTSGQLLGDTLGVLLLSILLLYQSQLGKMNRAGNLGGPRRSVGAGFGCPEPENSFLL